MKIFTSNQIHELDQYTIEHEPIRSIDLMERAAKTLARAISDMWTVETPMVTFAGPGNNGGDALAVSRLLAEQGYQITVYLFNIYQKLSDDCATNKQRIIESKRVKQFTEVTQEFDPPKLDSNTVVIDGLFGSGLNKPLSGGFASLVKYINQSAAKVVSIDMPSGLMTEDNTYNIRANIIKAHTTLTLQQKKLSFLFPENQQFIGKLKVLDIRLSAEGTEKIKAQYSIIEENDIRRQQMWFKADAGYGLYCSNKFYQLTDGKKLVPAGFPYMRSDEMLLIEAEAKAHMPGSEAEAQAIVGQLQAMRGETPTIKTGDSLVEDILLERRKELYGEGFAWLDIIRNCKPIVREGNHDQYSGAVKIPAKSWRFVYQIPNNEILNNPNINSDPWPAGDQNVFDAITVTLE